MRLNINHKFIKVEKEDKIDMNITTKAIISPEIGHTVRDQDMSYRGRGNYDTNYIFNYRGRTKDNYRHDNR